MDLSTRYYRMRCGLLLFCESMVAYIWRFAGWLADDCFFSPHRYILTISLPTLLVSPFLPVYASKLFLFRSCQITRTMLTLLWSCLCRGRRYIAGCEFWRAGGTQNVNFESDGGFRVDRLRSTHRDMRMLLTLGGFLRCSRMERKGLCAVVGTFVGILTLVRGPGDEHCCEDGSLARWRTFSDSTCRSYVMAKSWINSVVCYTYCGMLMLRPSIVDWTFAVLKIC